MEQKNLINYETVKEILKPEIIPFRENGRKFFNFAISAEIVFIALGLFLQRPNLVIIAIIILLVFPGMPLLFGLFSHFARSVIILDKKLVIMDYSFNYYLMAGTHQEISFEDIDYIYYLDKEYSLLKNYRRKLQKYKISKNEMDYRKISVFIIDEIII